MKLYLLLIVMIAGVAGCGARPITGEWFKHPRSYDYRGQSVELRMLSAIDLFDYAKNAYPKDADLEKAWHDRLEADFGLDATREAAPLIVLPIVLEHAIALARAELESEASLYEAQFGALIHETGFWREFRRDDKNSDWRGVPRWLGFELVRKTIQDETDARPAFRLVCGVIPATMHRRHEHEDAQDSDVVMLGRSDERLFVIKPLWMEVNRSRAKVARTGSEVDVRVNIRAGAIWIDRGQNVRNDIIADAEFAFSGIDLSEPKVYINELEKHIAGWFAGVPVSVDAGTGTMRGDGTFRLAVSVTESDPSQIREIIERTAKYLETHQADIIGRITSE